MFVGGWVCCGFGEGKGSEEGVGEEGEEEEEEEGGEDGRGCCHAGAEEGE